MIYDVIVVGSGPSGLMASIFSAKKNNRVLLLEKNNCLGKKLLASGGGRCNITNLKETGDIIHQYKNGKFLCNTLYNFSPKDIYNYFKNTLSVDLKEEDDNKIFPKSNSSKTILEALVNDLKKYNVTILLNESLEDFLIQDNKITGIKTNKQTIHCNNLVLATGGKSYPQLGTTGDGYDILKKYGHTITELYPTEVPLVSNESFILDKSLQGTSLNEVSIKINNDKSKIQRGNFIFTHFGFSGSSILRISEEVFLELKKQKQVILQIDLIPQKNKEELFTILKRDLDLLKTYIPKKLMCYLLKKLDIEIINGYQVSEKNIQKIACLVKNFEVSVYTTRGFNNSFVTGGGVDLKNVNPKNFESKLVQKLFIVGELLDIHAHTGGYNITSCLSMGYTVGNYI